MYDLELTEPTKEHEIQVMEYRQEYIDYGEKRINGSCGLMHYSDYDEWLDKVRNAWNAETSLHHVPATTYLAIRKEDNRIIGTIQLRHQLTEELEKSGGHIGYGIRPTERRKGYGTKQLELVLLKAKELGIPKVMISCDKGNSASARTAMSSGGIFTKEGFDERDGTDIQIYWIELQ